MRTVKTKKGEISYEIFGQGTPLVMLRGLGRTVKHWLGFDQLMAKHFKVLVTDLRGMGETTRKHGILDTVWKYADDLAIVLNDAKIERPHVMGVSLGGMAALSMGIRYPHLVESVILLNSSIGGQGLSRLSQEAGLFLCKALFQKRSAIHKNLVDLLVGAGCPAERRQEIAKAYQAIADNDGLYISTVIKQLLAAARFNPVLHLKQFQVPTMVVYGSDDRFVPNINSQNIARLIPHAQLTLIDGAGHEISADKPYDLEEILKKWIEDDGFKSREAK